MRREIADHWRNRAHKVRALADDIGDAYCRRLLIEIAARYEQLAARACELAEQPKRGES